MAHIQEDGKPVGILHYDFAGLFMIVYKVFNLFFVPNWVVTLQRRLVQQILILESLTDSHHWLTVITPSEQKGSAALRWGLHRSCSLSCDDFLATHENHGCDCIGFGESDSVV